MFKCNVNAALFARVHLAKSSEETRYYLNGVQVEPGLQGGVYLVATNGHAMLVGFDPDGTCEGTGIVALPAPILKACTSKLPRGVSDPWRLEVESGPDNGRATVAGMSSTQVIIPDATFPDWRRVVPENTLAQAGAGANGFDGVYLDNLSRALNPDRKERKIRLFATPDKHGNPDGSGPHLVLGMAEDMFGVIMPVRWNVEGASALPAWYVPRFSAAA